MNGQGDIPGEPGGKVSPLRRKDYSLKLPERWSPVCRDLEPLGARLGGGSCDVTPFALRHSDPAGGRQRTESRSSHLRGAPYPIS